MAYFECAIGGGANATIIATYDAALYGKTITCSNGIDTYTQTTTSSGVTEFEVDTAGTWTVTCDGISKTAEVVFSYDVPLTITKTITVYSAANDTLSFTDYSGSKTVTTNSSGAGSVSISYENGSNITFTSTVAKNPNDTTQPYSKQITLDENTTEIYVMPDGAWYWYGYTKSDFHAYAAMPSGESDSYVRQPVLTKNTNSFTVYPTVVSGGGTTLRGRGTTFFDSVRLPTVIDTDNYNTVKMLVSGKLASMDGEVYRAAFRILSGNSTNNGYAHYLYNQTTAIGAFTDLVVSGNFTAEYDYLGVLSYCDGCYAQNPSVYDTITVSAIWFE